jgi:hypothetical protein
MGGASHKSAEVYVDQFLEERIQRADYPPEAAAVVRVLLRGYRRAVRSAEWDLVSWAGGLLTEAAQEFRDDPDFPVRFVKL